jgi:hypothetical protein
MLTQDNLTQTSSSWVNVETKKKKGATTMHQRDSTGELAPSSQVKMLSSELSVSNRCTPMETSKTSTESLRILLFRG